MHPLLLDMLLGMDRLACSRLPSGGLFLSHIHAPSHAPIQTGRHVPSRPFCALFPGPQLPTVPRYCSGHWVCTWVPPPLHVHAHIYFSPPLMHTLFFTWSPFFFSPPCLLTSLLTVTQTHLYIPTHTPPLPRVGVHIRKKPGNPAGAGASAPSPTGTVVGLA